MAVRQASSTTFTFKGICAQRFPGAFKISNYARNPHSVMHSCWEIKIWPRLRPNASEKMWIYYVRPRNFAPIESSEPSHASQVSCDTLTRFPVRVGRSFGADQGHQPKLHGTGRRNRISRIGWYRNQLTIGAEWSLRSTLGVPSYLLTLILSNQLEAPNVPLETQVTSATTSWSMLIFRPTLDRH